MKTRTPVNVIMKYTGQIKLETHMSYITREVEITTDCVEVIDT